MDLKETVRATARAQALLSDESEALSVTSITIVELVLALEEAAGIEIPNREMTVDNFATVSSVVVMLERLRAATPA